MKIMAIDYGKARVGVAMTDPLGVIAQPVSTIRVKSQNDLIKKLKYFIAQNDVKLVLIGNPISLRGGATEMSDEVLRFMKHLRKAVKVEVKLWDERYTSQYAAHILKGLKLKKIKIKQDQIAASIILEDYLRYCAIRIS